MDISQTALEVTRKRLGWTAEHVDWLLADITEAGVLSGFYDVSHDRAVFHLPTESEERIAYVKNVIAAVKPGGHVIVSTFGPEGPNKCSGLEVLRCDPQSLHHEFGLRFSLMVSMIMGFFTSYPANWWLIRKGWKEAM
jgi:SAM-dependent methyltransferase